MLGNKVTVGQLAKHQRAPAALKANAPSLRPVHTTSGSHRSTAPIAHASSVDPFATSNTVVLERPASTPSTEPSPEREVTSSTQHKWTWRGHTINYVTAGCGDPIVLVHGFGLSSFHYRKTIKELSKSYKVYAVDLLGFGGSSKALLKDGYSMEVWRDQLLDFAAEFTAGKATTWVGNSIGGLACLMVAATAPKESVRGVVLLNTAGAMNNKGLVGDWRILALYPLLLFIDFLLSIPQIAAKLFNGLANKKAIRNALQQVYSNKAAVDDALVDAVYAPAMDRNARDVFVSVISGPPGPSPFRLVPQISAPILTLWGDQDTLTPVDGPVGQYFKELPNRRPNTTFAFLNGVGHCLHDDKPELVHAQLLPWLQQLHATTNGACPEPAVAAHAAPAVVTQTPAAPAVVEAAAAPVVAAAAAAVAVAEVAAPAAAAVAVAEVAAPAAAAVAAPAAVEVEAPASAEAVAPAQAAPAAAADPAPVVEATAAQVVPEATETSDTAAAATAVVIEAPAQEQASVEVPAVEAAAATVETATAVEPAATVPEATAAAEPVAAGAAPAAEPAAAVAESTPVVEPAAAATETVAVVEPAAAVEAAVAPAEPAVVAEAAPVAELAVAAEAASDAEPGAAAAERQVFVVKMPSDLPEPEAVVAAATSGKGFGTVTPNAKKNRRRSRSKSK